jgi:hypothetical protein
MPYLKHWFFMKFRGPKALSNRVEKPPKMALGWLAHLEIAERLAGI